MKGNHKTRKHALHKKNFLLSFRLCHLCNLAAEMKTQFLFSAILLSTIWQFDFLLFQRNSFVSRKLCLKKSWNFLSCGRFMNFLRISWFFGDIFLAIVWCIQCDLGFCRIKGGNLDFPIFQGLWHCLKITIVENF